MMLPPAHSSRILEITLISAQDLAALSQSMKTYAVVWVGPDHKLSTGVDQNGLTDPHWNDKFVFRVDDKFLNSEDAAIEVEIYAAAWVKDALIGHVKVLIGDLFTLQSCQEKRANNSATRVVSLHVRRASGRPQGILNMGVALLDSTMRSLPLYAESSICSAAYDEEPAGITDSEKELQVKIQRSKSDRTDLTTDDMVRKWEIRDANTTGTQTPCNGGSMVNGESLCSDVGPSASIVAAAIAQGLYKPGEAGANSNSRKNNEINAEVERRRMEQLQPTTTMKKGRRRRGKGSKQRTAEEEDEEGKFTCFGNVFGCQISISCGGGKSKKKKGKNNKVCHLSSIVDNYSQSYV